MSSLNVRLDNRRRYVSTETLRDLYNKSIRTGQNIREYMIKQNIPEDAIVSGQAFDDRQMVNLKMANKRGSSALEQSHAIDSSRGFTFSNYVNRLEGKPIEPYSSFTDGVYMDVAAVQGYFKSNSIFSMGNHIDQSNLMNRMNPIQQTTITQSENATPVSGGLSTSSNYGTLFNNKKNFSPSTTSVENPMYDHPQYNKNLKIEKKIFEDNHKTLESLIPIFEMYYKDVNRVYNKNDRKISNKKLLVDDKLYTFKTLIQKLFSNKDFIFNEINHTAINKRIRKYDLRQGNVSYNKADYDYSDYDDSETMSIRTPVGPVSAPNAIIKGIDTRNEIGISDSITKEKFSTPSTLLTSPLERSLTKRNFGRIIENPSL